MTSVEALTDSSISEKPAVIVSSLSPYSIIIEISPLAARIGIRKGMNLKDARGIEKNLLILMPSVDRYRMVLNSIAKCIYKVTPSYELLTSGEAYLNISGSKRLFSSPENIAYFLYKEILSSSKLKTQLGIGSNKLISKVASSFSSDIAIIRIMNGEEQTFISPISVRLLPDIGYWIIKKLQDYNISTIGEINRLGVDNLYLLFGRFGRILRLWSMGMDPRPVRGMNPHFIREELPLSWEENESSVLKKRLFSSASLIGFELRSKRLLAGRFKITITYADDLVTEGYIGSNPPVNTDTSIYKKLIDLFYRIRKRRVYIKQISVEASLFRQAFLQQELIALPSSREERLFAALDSIRSRFGEKSIRLGIQF